MESAPAGIPREELFARLAEGTEARITVVTPNRRLAAALAREFSEAQAAKGLARWAGPDILPLDDFVARLWEDALYAETAPDPALLLTPAQEQALWEEALGGTRFSAALLSAASAALQCREAWRLAHGWRLASRLREAGGNEDAKAFVEWSARYERATRERHLVDSARLADRVAPLLGLAALRKPGTLVRYGFDLLAPQAEDFLAALAANGTRLAASRAPAREARVRRLEFAGAKDEIAAAALWARDRLEKGAGRATRIGIVVPDLAQSRAAVHRALASVLHPGAGAPGAIAPVLPFEISLGEPLAATPIVHDALLVLRLAEGEIAFEDASRLIRSPVLAGAETEMAARARLDAAIRERAGGAVALDGLLGLFGAKDAPPAPVLAARLRDLVRLGRRALRGTHSPADWARTISEALATVGFPGERGLDSVEYQALKKWHALVAGLAALERVAGRMRYGDALGRLARMAADTIFQPETPEVPIQVLGVLESAGLAFDHLWVMGLTDEAWPLAARPNPFIPVRLQRAAGVPEAAAESSLALDRRITAGWLGAACEVVASHARMKGDSELAPSPLIAALPLARLEELAIGSFPTWRDAIHRARGALERIVDEAGPRLAAPSQSGGTTVFRDQAACPFRAFARHRLGSKPLEIPQPGLAARERGTLLHAMLAAVWSELGDKGRLDSTPPEALAAILGRAADEAIGRVARDRPQALSGRFAREERDRLVALAGAWLDFERGRGDFAVVATERKQPLAFGGLTVNARLDRLDRLAAGGHAVIDYKTGRAGVGQWLGPRPDEPQLPMYALGGGEDVAVLAFARVKVGEHAFMGIARAEGLLPGATLVSESRTAAAEPYRDWTELVSGWRAELARLGEGVAAGDARLDPKSGSRTCEGCDQHALCRIAERAGLPGEEEQDDE